MARKLPPAAVATHLTISSLSGNMGHFGYKRIAVCLYHRTSGTFWTYDDPTTVWPKMGFLNLRVPGGLGGASVWTLKDGDAHGTIVKTIAVGLR